MEQRTQQRGNITDHLDERLAPHRCRVTCIHGKEWPEGDLFERSGGKACAECCEEWQAACAAEPDKPMVQIAREWAEARESPA